MELLAGILDTDGYYQPKSMGEAYQITQKSVEVSEGIQHLCMSLGFGCSVKKTYSKFDGKTYGPYDTITIKGDTYQIPLRVEYKKSQPRDEDHSPNMQYSTFTIEPVDNIEYYGFRCSGDERYMLSDGTLTHNTWLLLKTAVAAATAGLNVGLYSGEMSINKVGYRVDTLISNISNSAMTHGNRSIEVEYQHYINSLKEGKIKGSLKVLTPEMVGGSVGVTALRAFIEKEHLDMLCVDQHSLLEDDRKARNSVDKAANISKDLQHLMAVKHIPIIAVCQQNRESTEESGITLSHISSSDRIGQDSTIVLSFEQKNGLLNLQLLKARDTAVGKKLQYAINFDRGTFEYMPAKEDAAGGVGCEELQKEFDTGGEVF